MEDIEVELNNNGIICANHKMVNGIFMMVSYHQDCSVWRGLYDIDRKRVLVQLGPFVRYLREFQPEDNELINIFGNDVFNALTEYSHRELV